MRCETTPPRVWSGAVSKSEVLFTKGCNNIVENITKLLDFSPGSEAWRYYGLRGSWHVVQYYRSCGLNVMPLCANGSKIPKITWSDYQTAKVPQEILERHFLLEASNPSGIGVICGVTSGFLEILDFDNASLLMPWCRKVAEKLGADVVRRLVYVRTPARGWHVYYRSMGCGGNLKLASNQSQEVQIETRGQGGQALLPGGPDWTHPSGKPYRLYKGSFGDIPLFGTYQRDVFLATAREFDDSPPPAPRNSKEWVQQVYGGTTSSHRGDRPGDKFNQVATWEEILEPAGWLLVSEACGVSYWRRPGKTKGTSASVGYCETDTGKELLKCFSSSAAPLEADKVYDKFSLYTNLHHGGDYRRAAEELVSLGFGGSRDELHEAELEVQAFMKGL